MGSQVESIVSLNPLVVVKLHPTGTEWRVKEKFDKSAEGSEFGKEVGELCSPGQAGRLPLPKQSGRIAGVGANESGDVK